MKNPSLWGNNRVQTAWGEMREGNVCQLAFLGPLHWLDVQQDEDIVQEYSLGKA